MLLLLPPALLPPVRPPGSSNNSAVKKVPGRTDTCADERVASYPTYYHLRKGQTNCLMGVIPLDLLGHTYISRQLLPKEQSAGEPPSLPILKLFPRLSRCQCPVAPYHMGMLLGRERGNLPNTELNLFRKNTAQNTLPLGLKPTQSKTSITIWHTCASKVSIP